MIIILFTTFNKKVDGSSVHVESRDHVENVSINLGNIILTIATAAIGTVIRLSPERVMIIILDGGFRP